MLTPAGKECKYYYEDFMRGRDQQECRLFGANPASLEWQPSDCEICPVPDILRANASPNMELKGVIKHRLLGFGRKLEVRAVCTKHQIEIPDPYVGCPKCNAERPGIDAILNDLESGE
jgi:hypothetical protein